VAIREPHLVARSRNRVLWRRRVQAGFVSQAELGRAVNASRQTINAIENNRSLPNVSLALAIARAVDASVEELFDQRLTGRV
jgi:putative transcriptional regulator